MTNIIISTVTLTDAIEYSFSGTANYPDRNSMRTGTPYWYAQDNIKRPQQYLVNARVNNATITNLYTLFLSHTWLNYCDDGDGQYESQIVITKIVINYDVGKLITTDQWEVELTFYKRQPTAIKGYWKFDYGVGILAHDASQYKNHGVITGALWVAGKNGYALNFDGADDVVAVPDSSSLDLTSAFTFITWIYPHGLGENNNGRILHKATGYSGSDGYMFYLNDNNSLVTKIMSSIYTSGNNAFSPNNWTHVAVTWTGTTLQYYINGVPFGASQSANPTLTANTQPLYIGNNDTGVRAYDGIIDELKIFNRVLSAAEILEEYQIWT